MTTTERGPSRSERLNPRNWSLSIKLLIVGLVPTLLALGLGALRISDQADVAANLGRSNELLAVRDQVEAAATALRAERDAAVRFVAANRTGDRAPVDAAAQTTDAQLDKAVQALASTESADDPSVGAQPLRDVKLSMQDLRRDTTSSPLPTDGILNRYGDVVSQTDVVVRTLLRQVANPDVAGLTDALAATDAAAEQLAVQHTVVAAAVAAGRVTDTDLTLVGATENAYNAAFNSYRLSLTPEQQQRFGLFGTDPANGARVQLGATILQTTPGRPLTIDPAAWDAAYTSSDDVVQKSADAAASQLKQDTTAAQEAASNQAGVNSVILMLGLLLGIAIIVLLARSLLKSLRLLRSSALDVAERQLPEAVESLRTGESPNAHVEPVPIDTRDEVGQVARAFDAVHGQAVRLAADQAALQANVNSMFVNLSRRSQALVERQLQLIEQLESNEQDPDQLSNLFQLDHLATRMRRNSENLLVLAGTELSKRNIAPIPVVDVLRAAVSEVEQYQRIVVQSPPSATVVGRAANDLVHLLAELLDNATNFSPPDSQVVLSSTRTPDGSILVEIADRGVGMAEHELTDANERLGGPAQVDVSASRRMGLFVVGRLAARHGIGVRLGSTGSGGLTASVTVPGYLIPGAPGDATGPAGAPQMPSVQDGTAGPALPALPQQVTPNGHVVPTGSLADLVVGDDGTTFPPLQTVDGSANGSGPGHHTNGSSPLLPTRRPGANLLSGTSGNGRTPGEMFTPTEADETGADETGWALSGPAPGAPAVPEAPASTGSADPATGWALSGPVVPEEELRAAHGLTAPHPEAPEAGRTPSDNASSRAGGAAAAALGGAAAAAALAAARRRARRQPPDGPTPDDPNDFFTGTDESDDARITGSRPDTARALLGRPKEPTPSPRHDDTGTGEIRIATNPDSAPLPRRTPRPIGPVATEGQVPDIPGDEPARDEAAAAAEARSEAPAPDAGSADATVTAADPDASDEAAVVAEADTADEESASDEAAAESAADETPAEETPADTVESDTAGSAEAKSVEAPAVEAETVEAETVPAGDSDTGDRDASDGDTAEPTEGRDDAPAEKPAAEQPAPASASRRRDIGAALAAGLAGTVRGSDDATARPADRADDTAAVRPLVSGPQAATDRTADEAAAAATDAGAGDNGSSGVSDTEASRAGGTTDAPPDPAPRPNMMRPVPRPGTTPSPSGPADRQPPSALPPPSRPAVDGPGRSGLLPRRIPGAGINRAPGGPTAVPPPAPGTPAPDARPVAPVANSGTADLTKAGPDNVPAQPAAPQDPPGVLPVRGAGAPVPPQGGDTARRVPTGEQPTVRPVGEQRAGEQRAAGAPVGEQRSGPPLPQRAGTPQPLARPTAPPPAGQAPVAQPPVGQPPAARAPVAQPPAAHAPVQQPPVAQPPVAQPPVAQPPAAQAPVAQPPAAQAPVAQPPAAQPPAAQPPAAQAPPVPQAGSPQTGGLPLRTPGAQSYGRPPAPPQPGPAYPQQGPPAEETASDDDGFSTPIFAEIASAWFRSNRPIPITWSDEVPQNGAPAPVVPPGSDPLQVRPSPVARPPAPAPVQPVEAAPLRAAPDASGPGEQAVGDDEFSSTADVGWEAAERNAETSAGEYTSAGLPKRRPRARLVPGSAGGSAVLAPSTPATASATATDAGGRTAEAVRGRLASYQRGIRQGRENRLRRERELAEGRMANSTDAQPAGAGAQDEETR